MAIRKLSAKNIATLSPLQVISSASQALKELLENAIDAKPSTIKINFLNNGLDTISVQDDGDGIKYHDLMLVGKQYCTGKNETGSADLYDENATKDDAVLGLNYLGFRGVALNAIVRLCESVEILTRSLEEATFAENEDDDCQDSLERRASDCQGPNEGFMISLQNNNCSFDGADDPINRTISRQLCAPGTKLILKGFLSNFPVRRTAWERSLKREINQSIQIVRTLAIANPQIRFRFQVDGKCLLASPGCGRIEIVARELLGISLTLKTFAFSPQVGGKIFYCSNSKTASSPKQQPQNHQFLLFFLNKRPIKHPLIKSKISCILKEHYISASIVIFLECTEFDVNLVPDKSKVILKDEDFIIEGIMEEICNIFGNSRVIGEKATSTPKHTLSSDVYRSSQVLSSSLISNTPISKNQMYFNDKEKSQPDYLKNTSTDDSFSPKLSKSSLDPQTPSLCSKDILTPPTIISQSPQPSDCFTEEDSCPKQVAHSQQQQCTIQKGDFLRMKVIGQFNNGFILCSLDATEPAASTTSMVIIDQHASDERIRLENFEENIKITTQTLMKPQNCLHMLDNQDLLYLDDPLLKLAGWKIREDRFLVGVPVADGLQLEISDLKECIEIIITINAMSTEDTQATKAPPPPPTLARRILSQISRVHTHLASRACRGAIMIGDHLSMKQQEEIVKNLATCKRPWVSKRYL